MFSIAVFLCILFVGVFLYVQPLAQTDSALLATLQQRFGLPLSLQYIICSCSLLALFLRAVPSTLFVFYSGRIVVQIVYWYSAE